MRQWSINTCNNHLGCPETINNILNISRFSTLLYNIDIITIYWQFVLIILVETLKILTIYIESLEALLELKIPSYLIMNIILFSTHKGIQGNIDVEQVSVEINIG